MNYPRFGFLALNPADNPPARRGVVRSAAPRHATPFSACSTNTHGLKPSTSFTRSSRVHDLLIFIASHHRGHKKLRQVRPDNDSLQLSFKDLDKVLGVQTQLTLHSKQRDFRPNESDIGIQDHFNTKSVMREKIEDSDLIDGSGEDLRRPKITVQRYIASSEISHVGPHLPSWPGSTYSAEGLSSESGTVRVSPYSVRKLNRKPSNIK